MHCETNLYRQFKHMTKVYCIVYFIAAFAKKKRARLTGA